MNASLQPEPNSPSRRALLAGALGGLGAWAAAAASRVHPVRAADGDAMEVGGEYTATTVTRITNSTTGDAVLWGESTGSGIGVVGSSSSNHGVRGVSGSSVGVEGGSSSSVGVYGYNAAPDQPASRGVAGGDSTGVQGFSGSGEPVAAKPKTGVYGYAAQDSSAVGVYGESGQGIGVQGQSNGNNGVSGSSGFGVGVEGDSNSSIGVFGQSGSYIGVYGYNVAPDQPASLGWSVYDTGVQGYSGTSSPVAAKPKTGVYGYANQDSTAKGVWGKSPAGHGVHGESSSGYAGYFGGKVYTTSWYELSEISTPTAPSANHARLFARVNSSGKTQLCVRFQSGAVQVIKTEP